MLLRNLDHLIDPIHNQSSRHIIHFQHDDGGAIAVLHLRQRETFAHINYRNHLATQVDHPAYIAGHIRHLNDLLQPNNLCHVDDADTILLIAHFKGEVHLLNVVLFIVINHQQLFL